LILFFYQYGLNICHYVFAIYYKKDGKEIKSIIIIIIIIMLCEIQALAQTAGLETSSF
jgi:uncharacterized transporter YbjL